MPRLLKEMSPARSGRHAPRAVCPVTSLNRLTRGRLASAIQLTSSKTSASRQPGESQLMWQTQFAPDPARRCRHTRSSRRSGRASGPTTRRCARARASWSRCLPNTRAVRATSRRRSRCRRCRRARSRDGRAGARTAPARSVPAISATSTGICASAPRAARRRSRSPAPAEICSSSLLPSGLETEMTGICGLRAKLVRSGEPQIVVQIPSWIRSPGEIEDAPSAPRASRSATLPGIGRPSVTTNVPATSPSPETPAKMSLTVAA